MPASTKYQGTVEKIGTGRIELVQIRMTLTARERSSFLKDPAAYYKRFLRAHRLPTNEFIASERTLAKMVAGVRRRTGGAGTATTHMTIHAHVTSPKKYKSRRITIITT